MAREAARHARSDGNGRGRAALAARCGRTGSNQGQRRTRWFRGEALVRLRQHAPGRAHVGLDSGDLRARQPHRKLMRVKLTLEYEGTVYYGWQMQAGRDSIQARIE